MCPHTFFGEYKSSKWTVFDDKESEFQRRQKKSFNDFIKFYSMRENQLVR